MAIRRNRAVKVSGDGAFLAVLGMFVLLALIAGLSFSGCKGLTVSDGYRSGTIQKATSKGIVFTTHEIEVAVEGHRAGPQGGMTNIWEASVYDSKLWDELRALGDEKIKFHYRQHRWVWPWNGATAYEVLKVEPKADK